MIAGKPSLYMAYSNKNNRNVPHQKKFHSNPCLLFFLTYNNMLFGLKALPKASRGFFGNHTIAPWHGTHAHEPDVVRSDQPTCYNYIIPYYRSLYCVNMLCVYKNIHLGPAKNTGFTVEHEGQSLGFPSY